MHFLGSQTGAFKRLAQIIIYSWLPFRRPVALQCLVFLAQFVKISNGSDSICNNSKSIHYQPWNSKRLIFLRTRKCRLLPYIVMTPRLPTQLNQAVISVDLCSSQTDTYGSKNGDMERYRRKPPTQSARHGPTAAGDGIVTCC